MSSAADEKLRLWAIRHPDEIALLEKYGRLRGDISRVPDEWRGAYRWMSGQLARRVGAPPTGCSAPIWAWYFWERPHRRMPDLRASGHLPRGQAGVRICFEVERHKALLSDFTDWHAVLNGHNLDDPDDLDVRRMRESWNKIFNLETAIAIQACLWQIEARWVRDIRFFTAR
jgi:hypothetical protein